MTAIRNMGLHKLAKNIHLFLAICFIGAVLLGMIGLGDLESGSLFFIITIASVINITLLALTNKSIWRFSCIYLIVYSLFHFGLIYSFVMGGLRDGVFWRYASRWLFYETGNTAAILALLGAIAFSAGSQSISLVRHQRGGRLTRPRTSETDRRSEQAFERLSVRVGFILLLSGILMWFSVVISSGGGALLFSSYQDYLSQTREAGTAMSFVWFVIGFGTVIVATAAPSEMRRFGWGAMLVFVAVGLPLGLRGEILFPLASAGAVKAMTGAPFRTGSTAIVIIMGLLMISAVREVRQVGLSGLSNLELDASVFDGIAEMGVSLRPVEVVIQWRDQGDDFIWGASYWAPIDRALYHVIPFWSRPPAAEDDRLMNVLVARRVGQIGFSPVAEAYRNFGQVGIVAVLFGIGVVLGSLDKVNPTRKNQLYAGTIMLPLIINVRNSFVPVPSHIIMGLVITYMIIYFSRRSANKISKGAQA